MATLVSPIVDVSGFVLHMPGHLCMSEEDFFDFCAEPKDGFWRA